MADKVTILTVAGLKKLEDELENLRSVKRQEVAERIKVAISYGDISENSEYDDAKNEQAFVEGRIIELEKMIRTAKIIDDAAISKDVVDNHTITTCEVSLVVVVIMEETVCHHKLAVHITEVEGWHTAIDGGLEKLVLERS